MKYIISLFFCANVWSAPINVFYEQKNSSAEMIKRILMVDYKIPEDLIHIMKVMDCERQTKKEKLELCLKNNGDLIVVSADRSFINESLKIFRAP